MCEESKALILKNKAAVSCMGEAYIVYSLWEITMFSVRLDERAFGLDELPGISARYLGRCSFLRQMSSS